jgi:type I restriction enzyme R subunit
MSKFTENHVEEAALEWLGDLGWTIAYVIDASPDGPSPIRAAYHAAILVHPLRPALQRLNPAIPLDTREEAIRRQ